jgi:hypothetical protein
MSGLIRRVERLETAGSDHRPVVLVIDPDDQDQKGAEAKGRHLARHPEDAGRLFVLVRTGVPRGPGFGGAG